VQTVLRAQRRKINPCVFLWILKAEHGLPLQTHKMNISTPYKYKNETHSNRKGIISANTLALFVFSSHSDRMFISLLREQTHRSNAYLGDCGLYRQATAWHQRMKRSNLLQQVGEWTKNNEHIVEIHKKNMTSDMQKWNRLYVITLGLPLTTSQSP